jgi:methylmalonyl-CoA carboxyltransferase 1.3S subunit
MFGKYDYCIVTRGDNRAASPSKRRTGSTQTIDGVEVKLKLTIDGKVYEVEVDATEPAQPHPSYIPPIDKAQAPPTHVPAVTAPAQTGQGTVADESKVCRSPMAGVVVRVPTQVGQQIQANDVLLVLEAMKMETVVTAPRSGKIGKINVKAGDPVQGGQILVEFE